MSDCEPSGATGLSNPAALAQYGEYVFITNSGVSTGFVSRCKQDPETKKLSDCVEASPNLTDLLSIAFTENGQWAYLSPYTGQDDVPVKRCAVSGTPPTLSNCVPLVSQRKWLSSLKSTGF